MPNHALDFSPEALLESHEDRLQRVEEVCNETRTEVAGIKVSIQALESQSVAAHEHLSDRMASGFERVFEKLDQTTSAVKSLSVTQNQHEGELRDLRIADRSRKERVKRWRGVLFASIAAGAGVLGTKIGEALLALLGK